MRSNAMAYPQRLVATTLFAFATLVMAACHGESSLQPESPTRLPSCTNVSCSGNGTCAIANGSPTCSCNNGYHADGLSCVPNACVPQCGSRVCGGSNGCGQTCGTCSGSNVCTSAGQCQPAPPTSASLKVVNNSSYTLYYLYLSPCGSTVWGPDLLGNDRIPIGYTATLRNIPCGQCYDMKVETSGHSIGATRYNNYFSCGSTFTWMIN